MRVVGTFGIFRALPFFEASRGFVDGSKLATAVFFHTITTETILLIRVEATNCSTQW